MRTTIQSIQYLLLCLFFSLKNNELYSKIEAPLVLAWPVASSFSLYSCHKNGGRTRSLEKKKISCSQISKGFLFLNCLRIIEKGFDSKRATIMSLSQRYNQNNKQEYVPRNNKKFIPKNHNTASTTMTLSNSLREQSSDGAAASSISATSSIRAAAPSPCGNFVNYLPHDEAVAAGLGADEGGLDPVESQRVVDLLNRELSRLLKLNPRDFWRQGFIYLFCIETLNSLSNFD